MVCRSDAVSMPESVVGVGKIKRFQGLYPCAATDTSCFGARLAPFDTLFCSRVARSGLA